jgi:hypothetical protein
MNKIIIYIIILLIIYVLIRYYIIYKQIYHYENNDELYKFIEFTGDTPIKNNKNPLIEMKKYNVIFAGTIKNIEKYIQQNLDNINNCGDKFNSYILIIYENDSTDKTREILVQNKKSNYIYIFEDNITEPRRTMRIANGRNKILEKIRELNNKNYYDYLIMLDMDDINYSGTFIESIKTCFEYDNWDILTGNQSNTYYDLWALRKKDDMEYDCWRMVNKNASNPDAHNIYVQSKYKNYEPNSLLEVDSAFGGIAIYKLSSIPNNCNYIGEYEDGSEYCEHVEFHRCIKNSGKNIYINTRFLTN